MGDRNVPATKGDILDLDQKIERLGSEVNQNDAEQLRSEMSHGYTDLVERMSDGKTRLLKAFYAFSQ